MNSRFEDFFEGLSIVSSVRLGGLTNKNYLIKTNDQEYVVRVPGPGTEDFINRDEEKVNTLIAEELGIFPKLYYFNGKSGLKIAAYIENSITLSSELSKQELIIEKIVETFKLLHNSNKEFGNEFPLFDFMKRYEEICIEDNACLPEDYLQTKEIIQKLQIRYEKFEVDLKTAHIDPLCENFILKDDNKMYLVDWEFSAMFDPLWDIAAYTIEAEFDEEEEKIFKGMYFNNQISQEEEERIELHKIFQDFLWSLWGLFKSARGEDFYDYALGRYKRCQENLERYFDKY